MAYRRIHVACLVMFTAHIGMFGLSPILPLYAKNVLGAASATVFLLSFTRDVVQFFLRIPLGTFSDKVGRKPLMMMGLLCYALTQSIYFLAPGPEALFLAMLVAAFGLSAFIPASQAWFAELAPEGKMGEAIGLRDMALSITQMVGPFVVGLLALIFPTYRPIFLITLGLTLLGGLTTIPFSVETNPPLNGMGWSERLRVLMKGVAETPSMLRKMFKGRQILASSVATFSSGFLMGPFEFYYPLYSNSVLGMDEAMIGIGFLGRSLASALSMTFWGRLSDRIGRLAPMTVGLALCATVLAMVPLVREYWLVLALVALMGIGNALIIPAAQAGMAESTDSRERGAGMGVWGTVLRLGMASGSFVMSGVVTFLDLSYVFHVSALAPLASVVLLLLSRPRHGSVKPPSG